MSAKWPFQSVTEESTIKQQKEDPFVNVNKLVTHSLGSQEKMINKLCYVL